MSQYMKDGALSLLPPLLSGFMFYDVIYVYLTAAGLRPCFRISASYYLFPRFSFSLSNLPL